MRRRKRTLQTTWKAVTIGLNIQVEEDNGEEGLLEIEIISLTRLVALFPALLAWLMLLLVRWWRLVDQLASWLDGWEAYLQRWGDRIQVAITLVGIASRSVIWGMA